MIRETFREVLVDLEQRGKALIAAVQHHASLAG